MNAQIIGNNIRRWRSKRGFTQAVLASSAGLSVSSIQKVEKGDSLPRLDTLTSLSSALGVGMAELLRPVRRLEHVRFRSFKSMKKREVILADVGQRLESYCRLEDLLDRKMPSPLSGIREALAGEGNARAAETARVARMRFNLEDDEPIWDVCGLLEAHGIKVLMSPLASDSFFGLSVSEDDGGPAIVVNTWEGITVERWIFSAVHELGHLILHLDQFNTDTVREEQGVEREADIFASRFLVPDRAFGDKWAEAYGLHLYDRVIKIKRYFNVSYKTILHRLSPDGNTYGELIRAFQTEHVRRHGSSLKKTDEPAPAVPDAFYCSAAQSEEPDKLDSLSFAGSRLNRLVREALEKELISVSKAAETLNISLNEMKELSRGWID